MRCCCRCGLDIAWHDGYYCIEADFVCVDCMVDYVVDRYYIA